MQMEGRRPRKGYSIWNNINWKVNCVKCFLVFVNVEDVEDRVSKALYSVPCTMVSEICVLKSEILYPVSVIRTKYVVWWILNLV